MVYVCQGDVASPYSFDYVLDTRVNPYQALSISRPYAARRGNAGLWTFYVSSPDGAATGYILQANWS